jgi:hypothetical protein
MKDRLPYAIIVAGYRVNKTINKEVVSMELTKKEASQILSDAIGDKCFFFSDGPVLCNLEQLGDFLQNMAIETFSFHVTAANNDFSNWVRDVLGDNELADKLTEASNQEDAAKIVKERIKLLKKKAA